METTRLSTGNFAVHIQMATGRADDVSEVGAYVRMIATLPRLLYEAFGSMFVSLGLLLLYRLIRGPGRFEDLPAGVREHDTFRKIVVVGAFLLGAGGILLGLGFLLNSRPLSLIGGWITGVALAAGAILRAVFWYIWGDLSGKERLENPGSPDW